MTHTEFTYEDYLDWYHENPMNQMYPIYSGYESHINKIKEDLEQLGLYHAEGCDFITEIYPNYPEDNEENWNSLYLNHKFINNYTHTINKKIANIFEKNLINFINKNNQIQPKILEQILQILTYIKNNNTHNYIIIGTYKISTTMFFLEKFIKHLNLNEFYIITNTNYTYNIYLHKNIVYDKLPKILKEDYLRILLYPIFPKYKMFELPF